MTSGSFDADALWDLYDNSDATIRGHVVPKDDSNNDIGTSHISSTSRVSPTSPCDPDEHDNATLIQTVTIRPGLSLPLHVPRSLLEDGCLGEVGGMVWDCSVVMARYLLLSTSSPASATDADDADGADIADDNDFRIDLTSYDHIVELGSGLGLLGFALHRYLCEESGGCNSSSGSSGGSRTQKITLTDYLPELVDAMQRTATDEIDSMGQIGVGGDSTSKTCSGDSSSGSSPSKDVDAIESQTPISSSRSPPATNPSLSVSLLDWVDPSDVALDRCRIQPGESVLIVASEVLYEPCHADMLADCIDRILDRSDCRERCRVLVANFAERPGWRRFVDVTLGMKPQGQVDRNELSKEKCCGAPASSAAIRGQVREMDLGSGGYELLDIPGDECRCDRSA